MGAIVPLDVLWGLSIGWYGDRLDPDYVLPPVGHYESLLRRNGLTAPFWRLT